MSRFQKVWFSVLVSVSLTLALVLPVLAEGSIGGG